MGTEEFWVPAVIAALGTGAQAVNQKQANQRENDSQIAAQQHQEQLQGEATAAARGLTQQIAKDTPQQIQSKATGDYVAQLRKNAAGSTQSGPSNSSALAPAAGASSRYGADTAKSQAEVQNFGNTYANEMGSIDAGTRMRQNEGLAMGTLGTQLNTLGAKSYGQNFVDQLRAQASGQANPWVSLLGGLLKNGASAYAMNSGSGAASKYGRISPTGTSTATGMPISADNGLNSSGVYA